MSVAVGGLAFLAVNSDGQTVHRTDLNDGGVWVSNQSLGALARENKPISQLDSFVDAGRASTPDVLQDGSAVVSVDGGGNVLTPVSASRGSAIGDAAISVAGPASLRGGTLAVVDPDAGALWATRLDPTTDLQALPDLAPESDELAKVGADALAVATVSGSVVAVSEAAGTVTTIPTAKSGFAAPQAVDLAAEPKGGVAQLSAVGDRAVILDAQGGLISGSVTAEVVDPAQEAAAQAVLQQPGAAATEAVVATTSALLAVDLTSGDVRTLPAGAGRPTAPVRVGSCVFAAWGQGTQGSIVTACDGQEPVGPTPFTISADAELVFRVNRNQVLLNDVKNGNVWNLDAAQPVDVADWQSFKPQNPEKTDSDDDKHADSLEARQAPEAKPDDLGARPGRTTVLHVLDNDLVSGGGVLSVVDLRPPDDAGIRLQLSPDRQSILLTLADTVQRDFTFRYEISDGTGGKESTDDGEVTIHVRTDGGSAAPVLRPSTRRIVYPLSATGTVELSVLSDWRDPEYGDPVSLDGVKAVGGIESTVTSDGLIRLEGAGANGRTTVPYDVSTGGKSTSDVLTLNVLGNDDTKAVAPQAMPDVAAGEVGGTISVRPLDNDIPGADPTDPLAKLELAGRVSPAGGVKVDTDLESGIVTVKAAQPGSYTLKYAVGFGSAARATAQIRVDVEPASDSSDAPIATPDTATVRGLTPIVVDVLSNDYDARGRLLAVQHAEPVGGSGGLDVAVVDGRWLRISATSSTLLPRTQAVRYTVSNGQGDADGIVSVTQKDPLPSDQNLPIAADDDVTVRVADTVVVPVLENDTTPGGDPVGLRTPINEDLPVGELSVQPALGRAYVSGRNVRYVAPTADEITGPITVTVQYVVENTADPARPSATGELHVRVNPPPSDDNPNHPPTPRAIEARVVEGDVATLRLPLVGNDVDGDSVSVVAIGSPPMHGRLLSYGANSLVYQSFPGAPGTDEFSYLVTDSYGETAQAAVRVAVTPPGAPQAPVAVDDVVTAAPGRTVDVDVLANDLRTPGTRLTILPLEDPPGGAKIEGEDGPISVQAPDNPRTPINVQYRVSSGFDESSASLTVRSRKGYNNPPVVSDSFARPEGDSGRVVVDVLARAYDIDGEGEPVELVDVGLPEAKLGHGGKVSLPVLDVPQVVPFRVQDGEGATASAAIYVPAAPKDTPYLTPGAEITLRPGETKDVPLAELVDDPEGDDVYLTLADRIVGAPEGRVKAKAPKSAQSLTITAADGDSAAGPASVTFEVSDSPDLGDPEAHTTFLTVPVVVGSGEPIINCPDQVLPVVEGGVSRTLDIATICHVWTPDPADAADLDFSARWAEGQEPGDVSVENTDDGVQVLAGVNAVRDSTGVLEVSVAGSSATDTLLVKVVAAGPPSLRSMTLETEAGKSVSIDVSDYAQSPFGSTADWALVGAVRKVKAPEPVSVSQQGTRVTLNPSAFGVYTFEVTLADDGGGATGKRPRATGLITMSVVSPPEPPTNVRTDQKAYDGKVLLMWNQPFANGGSIDGYTVRYTGGSSGTKECPSTKCWIDGLANGKQYSFYVTAHNQYGESDESKPGTGKPDRVPDVVQGLTVVRQRNTEVTLKWSPPATAGDYSKIDEYYVSWPGSGGGQPTHGATTYTARGLANGQEIVFSVWAHNERGHSPEKSPVSGMAAGAPETPVMTAPQTSDRPGNSTKGVTISWGQVGANGPEPVTYTVTRTGGGSSRPVCEWVQATSCQDDLGNDGSTFSYTVQARNGEATAAREDSPLLHTSAQSAPVEVEAAAPPEGPKNVSMVATGVDRQAEVTFAVGASHGKTNRIECDPSCGDLGSATVANNGAPKLTFKLAPGGYSNGSTATVRIRACNGSSGTSQTGSACSGWVSDTTTPYGAIQKPTINVSPSGKCLNWSVSGGNGNGKRVTAALVAGGDTLRTWDTTDAIAGSGQTCPGYELSRRFSLTVQDSGVSNEQPKSRGTVDADPVTRSTDNKPTPTINAYDGGEAPNNTGNCLDHCRWFGVTLTGAEGQYGWCSVTHQGSFRSGQTWWYRVGPTGSDERWIGTLTSDTGHKLAYNSTVFAGTPVNGCQPNQPSGNIDNG